MPRLLLRSWPANKSMRPAAGLAREHSRAAYWTMLAWHTESMRPSAGSLEGPGAQDASKR
jgi:hypothetical protein